MTSNGGGRILIARYYGVVRGIGTNIRRDVLVYSDMLSVAVKQIYVNKNKCDT